MARDTHSVQALQAAVLRQAGVGPVPQELRQRLDAAIVRLADDPDLAAATLAYRGLLAEAAGTSPDGLSRLLTDAAAAPVGFLGPLHVLARPMIERARALGVDLDSASSAGPTAVGLIAPAVSLRPGPQDPAGAVRATLGHLPVSGLSTRLDLGPVHAHGAGFLDPSESLAGAMLRADLGPVRVDVALLLESRQGLGIVAMLRAELRPTGIQLGLGFSLDAVGGVLGLNRTVDAERLRDRIADGSALDALFGGGTGRRQVRRTLDALREVFPERAGSHVVGPTLRLGWLAVMGGSLARLDVGVVLSVPSGRVVLPGRIVVEVPGPGFPLVHLRLDVIGEVDVAGRRLALDAALVDSKVLGALTVTGTAAVRLGWGEPGVVLATVGGFYPGFEVAPAVVPPQRRVGITLANPVPVGLRISLEGYLAAAAGTLQAGARISVGFEVLGTGIRGSASFDAIVALAPLWVEAQVSGKVSLRALGQELVSVDLHGRLTGPGPLVLTARATARIGFVKVGGSRSFTLSGGPGADRQPFDGLPEVVGEVLRDPANVTGDAGADREVRLAPRPAAGAPLVAPGSRLTWAQESFPLDGPFTRAAGRVLRHPCTVQVTHAGQPRPAVSRPLTTAAFRTLTTAEALAAPAFDRREVGWSLEPVTVESPTVQTVETGHRTVFLPTSATAHRRWAISVGQPLPYAVQVALHRLDAPAALSADVAGAVAVAPERWTVVTAGTASTHGSGAAAHAHAAVAVGARAVPEAAAGTVVLP